MTNPIVFRGVGSGSITVSRETNTNFTFLVPRRMFTISSDEAILLAEKILEATND